MLLEDNGLIGVKTLGRLFRLSEEEIEDLRRGERRVTVELDFGEMRGGQGAVWEVPWRRMEVEDAS